MSKHEGFERFRPQILQCMFFRCSEMLFPLHCHVCFLRPSLRRKSDAAAVVAAGCVGLRGAVACGVELPYLLTAACCLWLVAARICLFQQVGSMACH